MRSVTEHLDKYIKIHALNLGHSECETVLDQLYQAYAESHETDPVEIGDGFKELEDYLSGVPLEDNNAVFKLCCRLCTAYERKGFLDGLQYGHRRVNVNNVMHGVTMLRRLERRRKPMKPPSGTRGVCTRMLATWRSKHTTRQFIIIKWQLTITISMLQRLILVAAILSLKRTI